MSADKNTPRLLGIVFIFQAVASALSGLMLSSLNYSLIGPPDNISKTMINISDNPTTLLMSIVGELITAIGIVLLAVLLYTTLKKQNKIIALWAFGLRITEAVILGISRISVFCLLYISQEFIKAGVPDSSYVQILGGLFYESSQYGYSINMLFFTLGGLLFYYLFLKSKYIPKLLSVWGIIAASLALIGTLFELLGYDVSMFVFLPNLPFELAIGVWLIVKGFNSSAVSSESAKTDIN